MTRRDECRGDEEEIKSSRSLSRFGWTHSLPSFDRLIHPLRTVSFCEYHG